MEMEELADRTIAQLRASHDALAAELADVTDDQLAAQSGAAEWTVAQALSHLGSGAEINRRPIARAAGLPVDEEDNQTVWARWDTASPREQAAMFVEHEARYVETAEALTAEQRATMSVELGYLPGPIPVAVALGMRLNEVANHSWDARVGLRPDAVVDPDAAALLIELYADALGFLFDWSGKADRLGRDARVAVPGGGIVITDAVRVTTELADPTATFDGPQEAVIRLISGRLRPPYADGVSVTGNVTLDELRQVFPGY